MYNHNVRLNKVTRKDNGMYDCEVSGNNKFGEARVKLTVLGESFSNYIPKTHVSIPILSLLCTANIAV